MYMYMWICISVHACIYILKFLYSKSNSTILYVILIMIYLNEIISKN